MIQFAVVSNTDYHEAQILLAYNTKQVDDPSAKADPMIPKCYGLLAQAAGREGSTFTVDEWRKVSMGYNPFESDWSKHPLRANADKLDENLKPIPKAVKEHCENLKQDRDSLELVFSSDKSISMWWAAQDQETQDRYLGGVNKIMEEVVLPMLNRFAMYEQNNKKLFANGISFASWFNHIESRGVDPFLHTHLNLKNSVQGLDGKFHALCPDGITKNIALIDAVFQMANARLLTEEFGLKLEAHHTKVDARNEYLADEQRNVFTFAVAGVPKKLCREYSKRSEEIKAQLEKLGIPEHSHDAAALAQVSTRQQKTDLNAGELRENWRTELKQKWNFTPEVCSTLNRAAKEPRHIPTDDELMKSFDNRHGDVEFNESQFKGHVYKQLMLVQPQGVIERRAEELFKSQALPAYRHGQEDLHAAIDAETNPAARTALQHHLNLTATYTARYFKEPEDKVFADFTAREAETYHQLDKKAVIKGLDAYQAARSTKSDKFVFTGGQLEACLTALTERGAVASIVGMAGTGKTAVVEAMRIQLEAKGMRVIGTATANKAKHGLLEESGIKVGDNTTALLIKLDGQGGKPPKLTLTKNDVVILDEAGMTSGREICRLAEHVNRVGAKLICLGDPDQLQACGSSGLYRSIASRFVVAKMTDIQRQREDWAKEMVQDAAAGRSHDSFLKLADRGCISTFETTKERIEAIAKDFVADQSDPTKKFIVASLNDDADRINEEVQRQQLKRGDISIDLGVAEVEDRDGLVRRFHVGERIVFTKKTKNMDPTLFNNADNAATGRVLSIENRKGSLRAITVELDNGQTLTLDSKTAQNMKLGSALTTHKSQGATVANSYLFASNQMANLHQFYVQVSRHKENTRLYLSADQVNKIAQAARLAKPAPAQQGWAHDLIAKDVANNAIDEEKARELRELCETFQGCREYLNSHNEAYQAEATVSRQKVMQTKTLRDFVSLIEAYGKGNWKKSTQDMDILSESHQVRLEEVRQALNSKATQQAKPLAPKQAKSLIAIMPPPLQQQKPLISMIM